MEFLRLCLIPGSLALLVPLCVAGGGPHVTKILLSTVGSLVAQATRSEFLQA